MTKKRLFVEQRAEGDYAVRKPNSSRARGSGSNGTANRLKVISVRLKPMKLTQCCQKKHK